MNCSKVKVYYCLDIAPPFDICYNKCKVGENMLGAYLREVREKLGLSQEDLARMLNVSFATVNRWEKEKNKPSRLAAQSIDAFCKNNNLQTLSEWLVSRGDQHES